MNNLTPIIYIAGPYRSKYGVFGRILNILRARKLAKKVWASGFYAICPHLNSALMDGICPDEQFLEGDIEILKKCDAILMIDGFEKSSGAINELISAREIGIEIIHEDNFNSFISFYKMEKREWKKSKNT